MHYFHFPVLYREEKYLFKSSFSVHQNNPCFFVKNSDFNKASSRNSLRIQKNSFRIRQ
jgi:hypothetical protein